MVLPYAILRGGILHMNTNETMEIRLVTNIEKIADTKIEQTIFELDNQSKCFQVMLIS